MATARVLAALLAWAAPVLGAPAYYTAQPASVAVGQPNLAYSPLPAADGACGELRHRPVSQPIGDARFPGVSKTAIIRR